MVVSVWRRHKSQKEGKTLDDDKALDEDEEEEEKPKKVKIWLCWKYGSSSLVTAAKEHVATAVLGDGFVKCLWCRVL
jgi:hypothetical protein